MVLLPADSIILVSKGPPRTQHVYSQGLAVGHIQC